LNEEGTTIHFRIGHPQLVGFALTVVAGWIDAVGFLRLGGLYVSFMSGNTTQLGTGIGSFHLVSAVLPAVLILLFVVGALAAALLRGLMPGQQALSFSLGIESVLIAAALCLSFFSVPSALMLAPLPLAMGMQNVVGRSIGFGRTFVTGSLVQLGEELAAAALGRANRWSEPALTWIAMIAGAAAGALLQSLEPWAALALPLAGMLAITVMAIGNRPPQNGRERSQRETGR
jgi:uncharacterized membrane protein YoaK (UPF0700 family)